MDAGRNSPSIRQQPNQITYIMTTNTIELPCGATIVTDKVCGKYYIKATQRCSGKNIIVIHSSPLKNIRAVRAYLTEPEIDKLYKWMLITRSNIIERVQYGREPMN